MKPDCDNCPLAAHGRGIGTRHYVPSEISGGKIFFLGMNPAKEEEKQKRPFAPKGVLRDGKKGRPNAGDVLQVATEDVKLERGRDFSVGNIVGCTAPENDFQKYAGGRAVKACLPRLIDDLEKADPALVVALGAEAMKALDKKSRGAKISSQRGTIRQTEYGLLLPTFHPAYFIYSPVDTEIQRFYDDLEEARNFVEKRRSTREKIQYQVKQHTPPPSQSVLDVEIFVEGAKKGKLRYVGWAHQWDPITVWEPPFKPFKAQRIIGHNVPSDFAHLVRNRILPRRWSGILDDSMVLQSLRDENVEAALITFAQEHRMPRQYFWDYHSCIKLWKVGKDPEPEAVIRKNAGDVHLTRERWVELSDWLDTEPKLKHYYEGYLRDAIRLAADLELNGIKVSVEGARREAKRLGKRIEYRRRKIREIAGEKHVEEKTQTRGKNFKRWLLWEHLGLPSFKNTPKEKKPATDREHLNALIDWLDQDEGEEHEKRQEARDVLQRYMELSFLEKEESDLGWLLGAEDGFIYPKYNLGGTGKYDSEARPVVSGRWSARDPNAQQFASYLKRHIESRFSQGWLVQWDASQMEVRVAALYSHDPVLLQIFQEGIDPYLFGSEVLFGKQKAKSHRFMGKRTLLATIYGTGAWKLAHELNGDLRKQRLVDRVDEGQCQGLIDTLRSRFHVHTDWVEATQTQAILEGVVYSMTGRRRRLPKAREKDRHALNQAANFPIQSLASDLNTLAALKLGATFPGGVLATLVHDAGLGDVRGLEQVSWFSKKIHRIWKRLPTKEVFGFDLTVPMKIEVKAGRTWHPLLPIGEDGDVSNLVG